MYICRYVGMYLCMNLCRYLSKNLLCIAYVFHICKSNGFEEKLHTPLTHTALQYKLNVFKNNCLGFKERIN